MHSGNSSRNKTGNGKIFRTETETSSVSWHELEFSGEEFVWTKFFFLNRALISDRAPDGTARIFS